LAADPLLDDEHRPGLRPKRTRIVSLYTDPPAGATVICADELGPVSPRTFPPAPGWSADGHRIKAPLEYSRGPDKAWVYGALRVRDGQTVTFTARSRNTAGYLDLLGRLDRANPKGDLYVIADNLSSHTSGPIQAWLAEHPRVHPVPLPVGACWLNFQEGWWRLLRKEAFAGQTFADYADIEHAVSGATARLNHRATPWVWGRPPPTPRQYRRLFIYRL
jgi:DDE superfamily endonuclease